MIILSILEMGIMDWVLVLFYFAAIIGIGIYLRNYATTGDDFFLAGRKNSSWVAGLAFLSANLGALEIMGWTGGTYQYGVYVAHFYWMGAIPAMLFLGLYMMPFYYSSKIHSIPGYLKLRFDEKNRGLNAVSFGIMTVLMSGINLYAMALVLDTFLDLSFIKELPGIRDVDWITTWDITIWVSAITVGAYVTLGGLLSAIFTEIVQFFLIWFGLFLVVVLGIVDMNGIENVAAGIPESMTQLWGNSVNPANNEMGITWLGIVLGLGFVLSFGYWTTDFLVVQRAFSSKDLRSARLTPVIASFFKMALPFIVVIGGLIAYKLGTDPSAQFELTTRPDGSINYDSALPMLIKRYYPTGLIGLGVTALLAGFMAGQAGNVSAFNTVWTYDIYKAFINKKASDQHLVRMGRIVTVVGIIISIITAYLVLMFASIMDYVQAIFSWVNAPLFATMLLGMFWKRTSPDGAFWGLILGMLTSFLMFLGLKFEFIDPYYLTFSDYTTDMAANLWRAWWAWLITFVATIVITLFTKPKPDHELEGLVKSLTPKTDESMVSFFRKPVFWAMISLLVLIFLNIYFW